MYPDLVLISGIIKITDIEVEYGDDEGEWTVPDIHIDYTALDVGRDEIMPDDIDAIRDYLAANLPEGHGLNVYGTVFNELGAQDDGYIALIGERA